MSGAQTPEAIQSMTGTRPDTPRSAMALLELRVTIATVAILVVLASAAWYVTASQALGMSSMATGLGQVGARMAAEVSVPLFLAMWLSMMVAMMLPTVAPMVLAHRLVVRQRGEGVLPTAAFIGGYLTMWTAIGIVPLIALLGFRNLTPVVARQHWLPLLAGAILVTAGLYQFTPWKALCLRSCRSPLTFILSHDFGTGSWGAFRAGLAHGLYCLGCCWALMTVLVVMGLMNLVWMAVLAVLFLAEKNWRRGVALSRAAGVGLALLGLAIIIDPALLAAAAGVNGAAGGSGGV